MYVTRAGSPLNPVLDRATENRHFERSLIYVPGIPRVIWYRGPKFDLGGLDASLSIMLEMNH
jgi:hypothetical protein